MIGNVLSALPKSAQSGAKQALAESTFATLRHRLKVTKGPGSKVAGLGMAFELIEAAQDRWAGSQRTPRRVPCRRHVRRRSPRRAPAGQVAA